MTHAHLLFKVLSEINSCYIALGGCLQFRSCKLKLTYKLALFPYHHHHVSGGCLNNPDISSLSADNHRFMSTTTIFVLSSIYFFLCTVDINGKKHLLFPYRISDSVRRKTLPERIYTSLMKFSSVYYNFFFSFFWFNQDVLSCREVMSWKK
jgi:hypothetical protein